MGKQRKQKGISVTGTLRMEGIVNWGKEMLVKHLISIPAICGGAGL